MTSDPKTPAQLASDSAEAIRGLNHATLSVGRPDWEYPSDAYSVIGGLERAVGYLPQALGQVKSLLTGLMSDGYVGSTRGDPNADMVEATDALNEACTLAGRLNAALQRAHRATNPLTYEDPDEGDFDAQ